MILKGSVNVKKEDLLKLGLDEETAKKVETASAEELKGFIPKARFDEVNTEKNTLQASLKDRDVQLETLKKSTGDVASFKKQLEDLQADNKAKDEAHAAEIKKLKIDSAVNALLSKAKSKNHTATKSLMNDFLKTAELTEDGSVKGLDEQIKALAENKDTKFLFEVEETTNEGTGHSSDGSNLSAQSQNPFAKETFNMTEQGKLLREKPEKAKQLAQAAGVNI